MNVYNQSPVEQFVSIEVTIPQTGIHTHYIPKKMVLTRVVFEYSDNFKRLSHTFGFISHSTRNQ